ncbi:MAG: ExbD/TolR family protein [Candidatus Bruticola sp.]
MVGKWKHKEEHGSGFSDINVTPLTDVLLVLLIIFLITGTSITAPSHNIELPEVITREKAENISIVIDISADGSTYIGNVECQKKELQPLLRKLGEEKHTNRVIINGDKKADYLHVITAMHEARQAGLTDIALATANEQKADSKSSVKIKTVKVTEAGK